MNKEEKKKESPPIFEGDKGAAQMQIAIRYLHNIPNNIYEITMRQGDTCDSCDRVFLKLFHFRKKENEIEFNLCAPCIQHKGINGVLEFLKKNDNK
jgi:hypothetical protein